MYFKDLTKYKYVGKKDDCLNIGWLSSRHKVNTGEVPKEFTEKLWKYLRYPVQVCRGFHVCELCEKPDNGPLIVKNKGIKRKTGFYEMRVWGKNGKIYAAPSLIYHYVTCHNYKPPQEFIDAVLESEDPDSDEYYKKVLEYSDGYDFWLVKDRMKVKLFEI